MADDYAVFIGHLNGSVQFGNLKGSICNIVKNVLGKYPDNVHIHHEEQPYVFGYIYLDSRQDQQRFIQELRQPIPSIARQLSTIVAKNKTLIIKPKVDNVAIVPLQSNVSKYVISTQLGSETRHKEFKEGQGGYLRKHFVEHVAKYSCGFLNSEGGTLYVGIANTGEVVGVEIDRQLEDETRILIDQEIKRMIPPVFPDSYKVKYTPVCDKRHTHIVNLKVLELQIDAGDHDTLYQTQRGDVFIRRDASIQGPLKAHEIQEWTRRLMKEDIRRQDNEIRNLREKESQLTEELESFKQNESPTPPQVLIQQLEDSKQREQVLCAEVERLHVQQISKNIDSDRVTELERDLQHKKENESRLIKQIEELNDQHTTDGNKLKKSKLCSII